MHRPTDTAEFAWRDETAASVATAVPDSPAEENSPDEADRRADHPS